MSEDCPFSIVHAMARRKGGSDEWNECNSGGEMPAPAAAEPGSKQRREKEFREVTHLASAGCTGTAPHRLALVIDYALVVARRYRLRVREEGEVRRWAGQTVHLCLVFDDDGKPVPGLDGQTGPLLVFQASSKLHTCTTVRPGPPPPPPAPRARGGGAAQIASVVIDDKGTSSTFGVGASTYRHKNRTFRLLIDCGEGPDGGMRGVRIRTVTHLKSMRPSSSGRGVLALLRNSPAAAAAASAAAGSRKKRAEGGAESPPAKARAPRQRKRGTPAPELKAEPEPEPEPAPGSPWASSASDAPASPPPPPLPPPDDGDSGGEGGPLPTLVPAAASSSSTPLGEMFDAMMRLVVSDPSPPPAAAAGAPRPEPVQALRRLGGPGIDLPTIRSVFEAPAPPTPESESPPVAPATPPHALPPAPFRHESEGARAAAVGAVLEAAARLAAAAAALGLAHPLSVHAERACRALRRDGSGRLHAACSELAEALARPAVFDTALFGSREGRFRTRTLLEDLRFSGSHQLLEGVLAAWRACLVAPAPPLQTRDDAELFAEHAWNLLEVAIGFNSFVAWDLLPVDRDFVFSLLDAVDGAIAGHASPDPACGDPHLFCRALVRRARHLELFRETETATELYFRAWSVLQRTGHSPSRLEAHLLRELVDILARVPVGAKLEMATRLGERVYWYCETDEDAYQQALALQTLALDAQLRGQYRAARSLLRQALALLEPLPPAYRLHEQRLHFALVNVEVHLVDLAGVLRHARAAFALLSAVPASWHERDVMYALAARALAFVACKFKPADWGHPPDIEAAVTFVRFFNFIIQQLDEEAHPGLACMRAHSLHHLGLLHQYLGNLSQALACFEEAASLAYDVYPAYFPPSLPRVRKLQAAMEACRRGLAARSRPLQAPGPCSKASQKGHWWLACLAAPFQTDD